VTSDRTISTPLPNHTNALHRTTHYNKKKVHYDPPTTSHDSLITTNYYVRTQKSTIYSTIFIRHTSLVFVCLFDVYTILVFLNLTEHESCCETQRRECNGDDGGEGRR
jgi:hypothetical protein